MNQVLQANMQAEWHGKIHCGMEVGATLQTMPAVTALVPSTEVVRRQMITLKFAGAVTVPVN